MAARSGDRHARRPHRDVPSGNARRQSAGEEPAGNAIRFLGAAGSVTGSRTLVRIDGMRILVDGGLFQEPALEERNDEPFPVDPREIDAIVLTHAHIDHSGYVPRLVRDGFRGPIWCTPATAALVEILWHDVARISLHDAARDARAHGRHHDPPDHRRPDGAAETGPIYEDPDVDRALEQIQTGDYGQTVMLARGIEMTFRDAGHILGAASVSIEWMAGRQMQRLLFSGDLGRPGRPLLRDPAPPPGSDYVVIESTYGDRTHPAGDPEQDLAEAITDTVSRGGVVVIPAFAVQRTQEVLFYLRRLREAHRIPDVPVFLDSPMAIAATRLFARFPHLLDREVAEAFARDDSPLAFRGLRETPTGEDSRAINEVDTPHIVIAGAGMCDGGRVQHHLLQRAEHPDNTVLLVGFQAPGTLGARLIDGADHVRIFGQEVTVRAEVRQITSLSAHADHDEALAWLRALPRPPRQVFVIHGTPEAADTFARDIAAETGWAVTVPHYGQAIALDG